MAAVNEMICLWSRLRVGFRDYSFRGCFTRSPGDRRYLIPVYGEIKISIIAEVIVC